MDDYIETDWNAWRAAADLGRDLAANRHKLPLTDLVVAVIAKRLDAYVYSTDPHFGLIPDLKRYWRWAKHGEREPLWNIRIALKSR